MARVKKLVLLAHHLEDLRRSGLTDETIRLSGAYSETDPGRVAGLLGWEHPATALGPCLVFPFFDPDGHRIAYHRVKPDSPRVSNGRAAKYESPVGQPNQIYLPPRAREVVKRPGTALIITEGEKKALAADQAGYACVGLVGVWGWCKKREDETQVRELHSGLAEFDFASRTVSLAYDSDGAHKTLVRVAEWELAKELTSRGATVRVVRLSGKLGGAKVGLDDYLIGHGASGLATLLERASPPTLPPSGFSNTARTPDPEKPEKTLDVPRSPDEMAAQLVGESGGWPRCVAGGLVAPDRDGGVRQLSNPNQLFAYAGEVFSRCGISGVTWGKGSGCVTKQEFYEYLAAHCERFERADSLPHEPPLPSVFYLNPVPQPDGKFEALERFVGFFSPATDDDRSLLLACLLTPLWGGPPGKRPAFMFEGTQDDPAGGRGVGKSTIAQKIAKVYGGAFDIDASEPFARTRSRLLTPDAGNYRVLLMDNVKTFRLSSAELEGLVTSPDVNGHRLYRGQAGVPNYYTLFVTLNGASLSRDFAQRVIPMRFNRAKYRAGWEGEVDLFLAQHRTRLLADLIGVMRRTPARIPTVNRWGMWQTEILARVEQPIRCIATIDERTGGMDADAEDIERIRETFAQVVSKQLSAGTASRGRFLLSSSATTKLVELALNDRFTAARAQAQLKALGVPEIRKSDRKGQSRHLWTGAEFTERGILSTPRVIDYDRERERWSIESRDADHEQEVPD